MTQQCGHQSPNNVAPAPNASTPLKTTQKNKKSPQRVSTLQAFSKNLILAATYVPAPLPAQYHRPSGA
jgi:hypothetical protein